MKFWIDEIEKTTIDRGPIDELLEVIYVLQKEDTEPPKISAIRSELKHLNPPVIISESNMKGLLNSLLVLVPGFINIEGEKVSINTTPSAIKQLFSRLQIMYQQISSKCILMHYVQINN